MTMTAGTAATRSTARRAWVVTAPAPKVAATAPVKEKTPRISADVVINSNVPVDSVSGCIKI